MNRKKRRDKKFRSGRRYQISNRKLQVSPEAELAFKSGITLREARIRLQDACRRRWQRVVG